MVFQILKPAVILDIRLFRTLKILAFYGTKFANFRMKEFKLKREK